MKLRQIEKRSHVDRDIFQKQYLKPSIPLVFKDLASNWPASKKWTFEFFQNNYGDLTVPLYDTEAFFNAGKGYMNPTTHMSFREYLSLIQDHPTDLRMFLFNIFKKAPELRDDFSMPDVMDGWITSHPYLFFGGEGSFVNLHYDIDCSAVFLTQFAKRKRVILFPPDQSKYLYNHPFTVQSHVDVLNPDYQKFPAFEHAEGYETIIEEGETLFMPPFYWHYIFYTDGGYSMSLRANDRIQTKLRGAWNVTRHFIIDKGMNKLLGDKWKKVKTNVAENRANRAILNRK